MKNDGRGESRGGANRKYTQLAVTDVEELLRMVNLGFTQLEHTQERHEVRLRLVNATGELLRVANTTPFARVCLAYAVQRGSGVRRVKVA